MTVEPRMMGVLILLAEAGGSPVTKEELLRTVWSDAVVSEGVLKHVVWELRRTLGDDARSPTYIETLPRIGYRLAAAAVMAGSSERKAVFSRASRPLLSAALVLLVITTITLYMLSSGAIPRVPGSAALFAHPSESFPLTSERGLEIDPAFDPDGRFVVFSRKAGATGFDLFLQAVTEGRPRRLTEAEGDELAPQWSPDASQVAFVQVLPSGQRKLGIVDVDSGSARRFPFPSGEPMSVSWAANGKGLVISARERTGGPSRIYRMPLDQGSVRQLTDPSPGLPGDSMSRVSPDGKWVAFERSWANWSSDLFVVPFEGGEPRRLTFDHAQIAGLTWSSDGHHVIISSDRIPPRGLWAVPVGDGDPSWLPVPVGGPQGPAMPPGRDILALEDVTCDTNIWSLDRTRQQERALLISSTHMDYHPQASPDGSQVAFISKRSGYREVWVARADGSGADQVSRLRGPAITVVRWSPEGHRLLFDARDGDRSRVYILDLESGRRQQLQNAPRTSVAPSWAHDGRSVYLGSDRDGEWQIWRFTVDGSPPRRMTDDGGFVAQEDPDGQWLYYIKQRRLGIWRRPVEGGVETLVLPNAHVADALSWAVSRSSLFFLRTVADGGSEIAVHHLGTEGTTRVIDVPLPSPYPGLYISPDDDVLLYSQVDHFESDIHIVLGKRRHAMNSDGPAGPTGSTGS